MSRPKNWKAAAPPNGTTHSPAQLALPKLPVIDLQDTLAKLKESLLPIAWSKEEYDAAVRKADEFGKPGGIGEVLQARLKKRYDETEHWLEDWWDDGGYLGYRDPVSNLVRFRVVSPLNRTCRS